VTCTGGTPDTGSRAPTRPTGNRTFTFPEGLTRTDAAATVPGAGLAGVSGVCRRGPDGGSGPGMVGGVCPARGDAGGAAAAGGCPGTSMIVTAASITPAAATAVPAANTGRRA